MSADPRPWPCRAVRMPTIRIRDSARRPRGSIHVHTGSRVNASGEHARQARDVGGCREPRRRPSAPGSVASASDPAVHETGIGYHFGSKEALPNEATGLALEEWADALIDASHIDPGPGARSLTDSL